MPEAVVRTARPEDVSKVLNLQRVCYPKLSMYAAWQEGHLLSHQRVFPEGQMVAVDGDEVVGHSACLILPSAMALRPHSFREATGRGIFSTHDPNGDTLYGAEIMVHPDRRREGIGRMFYAARFELARSLGLHYFAAGVRIPGYESYSDDMSPQEYVDAVVDGRIRDRSLSALLPNGLVVRSVLDEYLNDPRSRNHAALVVWENPDFSAPA